MSEARLCQALLVIVDISGYTNFITRRSVSLLHAEEIITELMEAVIDRTSFPLTVNKLQGDAALLYREFKPAESAVATVDVLAQLGGFFQAFDTCIAKLSRQRAGCPCEACSNTQKLCLKAFVHIGEIAIKQVRQFEELAGENLIFIHRLLKNSLPEREYVLVSNAVRQQAAAALSSAQPHREQLEGLGEQDLWWLRPGGLPALLRRGPGAVKAPATPVPATREKGFQHLPKPGGWQGMWQGLKQRFQR